MQNSYVRLNLNSALDRPYFFTHGVHTFRIYVYLCIYTVLSIYICISSLTKRIFKEFLLSVKGDAT